jgi:hypothetical protein
MLRNGDPIAMYYPSRTRFDDGKCGDSCKKWVRWERV